MNTKRQLAERLAFDVAERCVPSDDEPYRAWSREALTARIAREILEMLLGLDEHLQAEQHERI